MVTTSRADTPKKGVNKIVIGFAAIAASAIIGTTGFAAAQTPQHGAGYGNTVNLTINIEHSANNVINVIINIFR